MFNRENEPTRWCISHEFARWATQSALRNPGAPIKGREKIYSALADVDFDSLFAPDLGPISSEEFNLWHRKAVSKLVTREPKLSVGWAAKIIAIYLKTTCYLSGFGREGLDSVIHPPIDRVLMDNLKSQSWKALSIKNDLSLFKSISGTNAETYDRIIKVFELIAKERNWPPCLRVEQFFRPRKGIQSRCLVGQSR